MFCARSKPVWTQKTHLTARVLPLTHKPRAPWHRVLVGVCDENEFLAVLKTIRRAFCRASSVPFHWKFTVIAELGAFQVWFWRFAHGLANRQKMDCWRCENGMTPFTAADIQQSATWGQPLKPLEKACGVR
jgi:hypothetical protein